MAEVTRINVKQKDGSQKAVAFLSDIKLNTVAQGDLITVTTNTDNKTATVSVDNTKLSLENGNVKVNTPLEFTAQTTTPTETTGLRAVSSGGTTKLYWGSNVIEAHDPEEGYVTNADFLAHTGNTATDVKHVTDNQLAALNGIQAGETVITDTTLETALTPIETAIDTLEGVTSGYTGEGAIQTAVNAVDAKVDAVDAKADAAQTTADSALATASTAVQTASGDANIDAAVSDTALSVGVKTGSTLADILSVCTITTEEE